MEGLLARAHACLEAVFSRAMLSPGWRRDCWCVRRLLDVLQLPALRNCPRVGLNLWVWQQVHGCVALACKGHQQGVLASQRSLLGSCCANECLERSRGREGVTNSCPLFPSNQSVRRDSAPVAASTPATAYIPRATAAAQSAVCLRGA